MERYLYGAIKSQEDESVRHTGIAVSLHGLGNICGSLGEYGAAREYCIESLQMINTCIARPSHKRTSWVRHAGIAVSRHGLGNTCDSLGEYGAAREYCI